MNLLLGEKEEAVAGGGDEASGAFRGELCGVVAVGPSDGEALLEVRRGEVFVWG